MRNSTRLLYPELYDQLDRGARKERKIKQKLADAKELLIAGKITFDQYERLVKGL